ncbi:MAG TPA: hypothetical protein VHE13_08760, partial [Opitutus sp.]|nr:hypothetical protein [Opitutus sp.]
MLTIFGVGGIGISNSSGLTQTIGGPTALGGSQTWATSGSGSNLTFNGANNLAGYTLTIDADSGTTVAVSTGSGDVISGSGSAIVKDGTGTLNFVGNVANTFDGGFTLNDGTVGIRNNASLGTGTITLAGGTLTATTTNDKVIANALAITGDTTISGAASVDYQFTSNSISNTGGSVAVVNTSGSGTVTTVGFTGSGFDLSNDFSLGDATELRVLNTSGTQTFSGQISGTGVVHQNAAGGTAVL